MCDILQYKSVHISYGMRDVVRDVSFSLKKGQILGIAGESGSGKTSLIRAAMGLLGPGGRVSSGRILYEGMDLARLTAKERRAVNGVRLAMIFQNPGAYFCPVRKTGTQLYEAVRAHQKIPRAAFTAQVLELLEKTGFEDPGQILEKYPFELSGGMIQRIAVVCAMFSRPQILLADEPTSALDAAVQKQVLDLIRSVRDEYETSVLIVTHNLEVIRAAADEVLIMKDGMVVESGQTVSVMSHPTHAYTKELISAAPRLRRPL